MLRRFKEGGHAEREALVMQHARAQGYPVPEVLATEPNGLVLEKIEGETMWRAARSDPSGVRSHAASLARLHQELHEIDAPPGLPRIGDGARLLHLDLHPANVILSPEGPVVIDWTNARGGVPSFDVAMTWVIGATSSGSGRLGGSFLRHFLSHFEPDDLRGALRAAADYRLLDRNLVKDERWAIQELIAKEGV